MLFNSIDFAIFLPLVFVLYWFVFNKNIKIQNAFLLIASYIFYGWWDWRFLFLILLSSIIDYLIGVALQKNTHENQRKILLYTSVFVNLGILFFFKYFNFFVDSFVQGFTFFGYELQNSIGLNIILPVGISFYTFQTMSYTIDVYRRKLDPTNDIIAFFAFVTFFPQLVAGPIERAQNLLPQFYLKRKFEYLKSVDGLRQILWGLFKKVVIADNCATYANEIFNNYTEYSGSTLILGAIFFTFQIYGDFSGYSDIAIGTSKLFGFNLMKNFDFPYFSRDIAEFWRRWHISLSTWFRDYLYIPLGGSRGGNYLKIRNTFIIFVVSGFWHGANWTFIFWGFLNACYFLPLLLLKKNRMNVDIIAKGRLFPSLWDAIMVVLTFSATCFAWVFFRAPTISDAFSYIIGIFESNLFMLPEVFPIQIIALISLLILIEWVQRERDHGFVIGQNSILYKYRFLRWGVYFIIILSLFILGGNQQEFIYFQF